jgi:1,4-alpha-glucan branching enzyme
MIKREVSKKKGAIKVTFSLPSGGSSVAGDFNGWDPSQGRMQKRSNGAWSYSALLTTGQAYQFRYVSDGGVWFNDDHADGQIANEHGATNSVIAL